MTSTELAVKAPNGLDVQERERIELIKRTVAKGTTDDELQLFLYTAKRTGLDPLLRQIYAVKRWNKALGREVMSIQVGIDGFRATADRTDKYAGNDDYEFDDSVNQPTWAKARIWKMIDGQRCPFEATARWLQYYPSEPKGQWMWNKMPHLMLGKCAEALALRKAFPQQLSGLYVPEEMHQADSAKPSREQVAALKEPLPEDESQEPPTEEELGEAEHKAVQIFEGMIEELRGYEQCSIAKVICYHKGKETAVKIVAVDEKLQADFRKFFQGKLPITSAVLEKKSPKTGGIFFEARTVQPLSPVPNTGEEDLTDRLHLSKHVVAAKKKAKAEEPDGLAVDFSKTR